MQGKAWRGYCTDNTFRIHITDIHKDGTLIWVGKSVSGSLAEFSLTAEIILGPLQAECQQNNLLVN